MRTGGGIGLITVGVVAGLVVVLGAWARLRPRVADIVVALLGATIGAGAILLRAEAGVVDWILVLAVLGVGTPVHCRLVFGPPGRST